MAKLINIPENKKEKGQANGYPSLDGTGKIPVGEIPSSVTDAMTYKGPWDASGGTFPAGTPANGDTYRISVAGTLPGALVAEVGDSLIYDLSVPQWDLFQANLTIGDLINQVQQNGANLSASVIVHTDAAKKFVSVAINSAYNKIFGAAAGNVPTIAAGLGNTMIVETNGSGQLITATKLAGYNNAYGFNPGTVLQGSSLIERSGFEDRSESDLTWSDAAPDRTLEIDSVGADFTLYVLGKQFVKAGPETKQIADTEGLHWIYYDSAGILQETTTFTESLIALEALVAVVYWDVTNSTAIYVGDERHGWRMSGDTHIHLHEAFGARWINGLGLTDILADQSGALDTHAQLGYEAGEIHDEDLDFENVADAGPTQLPPFFLSGATPVWRSATPTNFPLIMSGGTRPAYNLDTAGTWSQQEVSNMKFFLTHIVALNDLAEPVGFVQGINEYNTLNDAQAGAETEITDLRLQGLPFAEFVFLGTVIFQVSNAYGNAVKARIRSTLDGSDYVDWRQQEFSNGVASPASPSKIDSRDYAPQEGDDGGFTGVTLNGIAAQSSAGVNPFLSGVVYPARSFDQTLPEFLEYSFEMPGDYIEGEDLEVVVTWMINATVNSVRWQCGIARAANGDTLLLVATAVWATPVNITVPGVAIQKVVTRFTFSGTNYKKGDTVVVNLFRDPANNPGTSAAADANVVTVKTEFPIFVNG